jgi:hypothetical protein
LVYRPSPPPASFKFLSSVADPDPGLGAFLTPGSGIRDPRWEKVSIRIRDPRSGMNNPDHIF